MTGILHMFVQLLVWFLYNYHFVLESYITFFVVAETSVKVDVCTHPGSFGSMCIRCGQKLDGKSGVTFGYIHKVSTVSDCYLVELKF